MEMSAVNVMLAAVLLVCAILLLWPFIFYPLLLRGLPSRSVVMMQEDAQPSASLLFCAYNEAASLPAKVANLRAIKARHPALEILAFDDGSDDGTADLLAATGDLVNLVRGPGRSGKAHGMKRLAAMARGDVLIFTDANVLLDIDAIDKLLPYYADSNIGGVLGSLHYGGTKGSSSATVGALYWRLEEYLKDMESRSGNVLGADGSIFSIRRSLYPHFPDDVLDDLTVSMAVIFAGKRLVKARDVIAREMMVVRREDEFRRKIRIAARSWNTHLYLRPHLRAMAPLDRFKYVSRKIVRWFGGLWLAIGTLAALLLAWDLSPEFAIALFTGSMALILIGLKARRGPAASLMDILLAYIATLIGFKRAIQGAAPTIWTPAKSRD
jgi:cellulose synthase/poly-beta-1,6-N-acetylglucosamine synthase-like glycosyltransferase